MRFAPLVATFAAAAVVSAQNQTVIVNVGASSGNAFQFIPNQITATNGSVVTFKFTGVPGFHSVTQAAFQSPCQPLEGGFDSGFVEILKNGTDGVFPEWNLTITNDSAPIWFFCKQLQPSPHCLSGMVGVINVKPGANSLAAFQAAAVKAGSVGQQQNGLVGIGASASAPPSIPSSIATLVLGSSSASATSPSGSGSGGSSSQTSAPGGAVALGVNFNLFAIVGGILAGAAMVL
ncbi:hypothetical protein MVEN_01824100 [Mycena venus]|uniref:Extracellular serine-rich protein n=1 Tax=Mycena venus TaxID=2733690 RepID=A0A8H7CLS0_9AGAR|nr:hypothetical protein MVEN_01824100 [Mycena venus]